MDDSHARTSARARVARAAKAARREPSPESAEELATARRDYAAVSMTEYIRRMVDEWPPLTGEQIAELRALFDPVPMSKVKSASRPQRT